MTPTPLPRGEFAVTKRYAYLNHAAVGTLARSNVDSIDEFVRAHAKAGVLGTHKYDEAMPAYRDRIGRFIGASGPEIATIPHTSEGAAILAAGIDWKPGDAVLLSDNEFPSNAIAWVALKSRGVDVRMFSTQRERLTPDALARELAQAPHARVVTVSWVSYADGYRHDLAGLSEVAHRAGALLFVDAIQGLGAFPLDVRACGVDAAFGGAGKWMLGLHGIGYLYVSSALMERLAVAMPGWRSMHDMWDFHAYEQPYTETAVRYEGGSPNLIGTISLVNAMDMMERCGKDAIASHVLELTDRLCAGLDRLGAQRSTLRGEGISSGIVTFSLPGCDSVALGKALQREGIVTTWRPSGIRVSPHGYNTTEEIDRLLELAPQCARVLASKA